MERTSGVLGGSRAEYIVGRRTVCGVRFGTEEGRVCPRKQGPPACSDPAIGQALAGYLGGRLLPEEETVERRT